jgi:rhodanese-related sulfurtransferase
MELKINKNLLIALTLGFFLLILFIFFLVINSSSRESNQTLFQTLASSEFDRYIENENTTVIDVRTPEEYTESHLKGALNIDFYGADFRSQLDELDKNISYAVYCRSGNRSSQTLKIMQELGFTKIAELKGGIASYTFNNNCEGRC